MKRTKKARKTRKKKKKRKTRTPPKRHRRKRKRAKKRSARRWRTKKKTPKMRRTRRKTAGRPNARRRMKAKKKTLKRAGADWNARGRRRSLQVQRRASVRRLPRARRAAARIWRSGWRRFPARTSGWKALNPTVRAHSRRTFWLRAEKRAANAYPLNRSKDDNVNDGRQSPTARHLERSLYSRSTDRRHAA